MKPEHEQSKRRLRSTRAIQQTDADDVALFSATDAPRVCLYFHSRRRHSQAVCSPSADSQNAFRKSTHCSVRVARNTPWTMEKGGRDKRTGARVCRGGRVGDRVGGRQCWKECIKASTQNGNVRGTKTDTTEDLLWEWRNLARRTHCTGRELDS